MGTNSGSMHKKGWHPYHGMLALAAENAAAKGKKPMLKGPRSPVIWPGVPEDRKLWAKLNPTAWSRGALPEPVPAVLAYKQETDFDIEPATAGNGFHYKHQHGAGA